MGDWERGVSSSRACLRCLLFYFYNLSPFLSLLSLSLSLLLSLSPVQKKKTKLNMQVFLLTAEETGFLALMSFLLT